HCCCPACLRHRRDRGEAVAGEAGGRHLSPPDTAARDQPGRARVDYLGDASAPRRISQGAGQSGFGSRREVGLVVSFMVRRLLQALIVVLGVTLIAFILQNLIASGPELARAIIGPKATSEQASTFIAQYGLNHPIFVQYLHYLGQLLRGNLVYSYKLNEPVRQIIGAELPKDIFIVGVALLLSILISVPLGVAQAVRRNKLVDHATTVVAFVFYSMPSYWLALLLISAFAVTWRLLPAEGAQGTTLGAMLTHPAGLVLA